MHSLRLWEIRCVFMDITEMKKNSHLKTKTVKQVVVAAGAFNPGGAKAGEFL